MGIRVSGQIDQASRCNCVSFYRHTIRLRQLIFRAYRNGDSLSEGQAIALLICMDASGGQAHKALAKLVGENKNNASDVFRAHLRNMGYAAESEIHKYFWELLADLQFKGLRGPRLKGRTLLLFLDALLLFLAPHGYLHLLRDDLTLRLEEYAKKEQTERKRDRWTSFWKAMKAAEMSSRRIWIATHDKPPERPPADWWLKVACQKGFTAESTNPLAF